MEKGELTNGGGMLGLINGKIPDMTFSPFQILLPNTFYAPLSPQNYYMVIKNPYGFPSYSLQDSPSRIQAINTKRKKGGNHTRFGKLQFRIQTTSNSNFNSTSIRRIHTPDIRFPLCGNSSTRYAEGSGGKTNDLRVGLEK